MHTLGDVITAALIVAALIVVPYKLLKAWVWPLVRPIIMSRYVAVPAPNKKSSSHRPYATEQAGTIDRNSVPDLAEQIGNTPDDDLLDILAQVRTVTGEYRYAESRIARFIGGRVEDRITQVRAARGIPSAYHTPIAQRRTAAAFPQDDPDLVYQPPN